MYVLTSLRTDGAVWKSLRGQFLAHTHQADTVHLKHDDGDSGGGGSGGGGGGDDGGGDGGDDDKTHLNDMVVNPDASVTAHGGDDGGDNDSRWW